MNTCSNYFGENTDIEILDNLYIYHSYSDRTKHRQTIFNVDVDTMVNGQLVDRLEINQEDESSEVEYSIYMVLEGDEYDYGVDIIGFDVEDYFTGKELERVKKVMLEVSESQYNKIRGVN